VQEIRTSVSVRAKAEWLRYSITIVRALYIFGVSLGIGFWLIDLI